jgi:tetratricopeptide (TPR) repeat protein
MSETPVTPNSEQEEKVLVYLQSATEYVEKGAYDQAIILLQAAVILQPDNIEVLVHLANAYFQLKQFDDALLHLQHAYHLDPSAPDLVQGMGEIFLRMGRWDDAIIQIEALYPIHQEKALQTCRHLLAAFSGHTIDRLLKLCNKHFDKG